MHWHGQHHIKTPYMDGVPYVSQCPILTGSTFRYDYVATEVGTHFWHSHLGVRIQIFSIIYLQFTHYKYGFPFITRYASSQNIFIVTFFNDKSEF